MCDSTSLQEQKMAACAGPAPAGLPRRWRVRLPAHSPCGLRFAQSVSQRLRCSVRSIPQARDSSWLSYQANRWWVVSVMLRRWSGWTSVLQTARDLYAATNPKWVVWNGGPPRLCTVLFRLQGGWPPEWSSGPKENW